MRRPFLLRWGLPLLLAGLLGGNAWAEEGLHKPGSGPDLSPGLEWLPVERDPLLKVAPEALGPILKGKASYYGKTKKFHGRRTASGDRFDPKEFTAASNRFPLGTWVAVKRADTEHCVVVRVNDRMHSRHKSRVADLSLGAAQAIEMIAAGIVSVEVRQMAGPPGLESAVCLQAFESLPDIPVPEPIAD